MQAKQELLQDYIEQSRSAVFFGGAGVSTESGLPDFRSTDGIYQMKYPYSPEQILSAHRGVLSVLSGEDSDS